MGYKLYNAEMSEEPVVDVAMIAYNHEKYIAQALDSVLMQVTEYSYRIIIGDDCSTDHTGEILKEYYEKHKDVMTILLWNSNVGMEKNSDEVTKLCSSKYIANLEGDDYWTAKDKLQRQISFLEKHSEYIATSHNVITVDDKDTILHRDYGLYQYHEEHIYDADSVYGLKLMGQTGSIVHRNIFVNWNEEQWNIFEACCANGDMKLNALLGLSGDVYCFREIMSAHRRVFSGDSWTAKTYDRNIIYKIHHMWEEISSMTEKLCGKSFDLTGSASNARKSAKERFILQPSLENLKVYLQTVHG